MSDIKRLVMRKSKLVLETFGKFDNTHQICYTHNTGLLHVKKKIMSYSLTLVVQVVNVLHELRVISAFEVVFGLGRPVLNSDELVKPFTDELKGCATDFCF